MGHTATRLLLPTIFYTPKLAVLLWRSATISAGRLKTNSYVASILLNSLALMTSHQDKSTISNNSIASHSAHFFTSYTLTMAASLTLMPKRNSIGANG